MKKKLSFILIISLLFFASCFHKDVKTGNADDIKKAVIFKQGNKSYMAVFETVFQATSKSSGGGFTQISGYNDCRISVYDLSAGSMMAREKTGTLTEDEANEFLGYTPDHLWFYSVEKEVGFHSLDPLTLKTKTTKEKLFEKNAPLLKTLANPKWYEISRYFLVDPIHNRLQFTDNQGYTYMINPSDFVASKLPDSLKSANYSSNDCFTTSIQASRQLYFNLITDFHGKKIRANLGISCTFKLQFFPI